MGIKSWDPLTTSFSPELVSATIKRQIKKHKLLFYIFENSQIKEYKPVPVNMSKLVLQYLSEIQLVSN